MNMNCDHFSNNLFAYHEGTLSDEDQKAMEAHLSDCVSCAELNRGFINVSDLIVSEKKTEPNPFMATRILQYIEAGLEQPESQNSPVWLRILQPVAIAVALITGIFIGSYTAKTGNTDNSQLVNKTEHIQFLKSDLYISEFTDENNILDLNK